MQIETGRGERWSCRLKTVGREEEDWDDASEKMQMRGCRAKWKREERERERLLWGLLEGNLKSRTKLTMKKCGGGVVKSTGGNGNA